MNFVNSRELFALEVGNLDLRMNYGLGDSATLSQPDPCAMIERLLPEPVRPTNVVTEKLNKFVELDADDEQAIERITRNRRTMRAHQTLVHEGSRPHRIYMLLNGVAFRYRFLPNGRRQILGYLLAGDICDTHFVISDASDHSVGLLSDSEIALVSVADLMATMVGHPKIERALLMSVLVDAATLREWLLNVGQRDAFQKLAHFFCEFTSRLASIGSVNPDGSFSIPLTQIELGDSVGLTVVHVNRVLQRFRREGILIWNRRRVTILNPSLLETVAGFNQTYLHLGKNQVSPTMGAYG